MPIKPKCVLYARKSTDREDMQILSISAQLTELREFAARSEIRIHQELVEHCSARKPGRPVFSKLLKDIQEGKVERILAWRLDRLARNPVDGGQLIYLLGEGVLKELMTPEGTFTGAGDSKFMLSVLFGAATKMVDDLSAGVKRGNRAVLKSGRITWRAPLGYLKIRDREGHRGAGVVVPDPERFSIVQQIWKEMATGTVTVTELWRRSTNKWGLRMRDDVVSHGRKPSSSYFYSLLRNSFYKGVIESAQGTFEGGHIPMATPEEFERVQNFIHSKGASRPSRNHFLYTGLIWCGHCGRILSGERHTKPSGLEFIYYRCSRRRPDYPACRAPAPREEMVTLGIYRMLKKIVITEKLKEWIMGMVESWESQKIGSATERVAAYGLALKHAEQQLKRLYDLLVSGYLSEADFSSRRDEQQMRITSLKEALAFTETEFKSWRNGMTKFVQDGWSFADTFLKGDVDSRRRFIAHVSDNMTVTNRVTSLQLRTQFNHLIRK